MVFSNSAKRTLECAIVLEEIAEMAYYTMRINPNIEQTELSEIYAKHKSDDNYLYLLLITMTLNNNIIKRKTKKGNSLQCLERSLLPKAKISSTTHNNGKA